MEEKPPPSKSASIRNGATVSLTDIVLPRYTKAHWLQNTPASWMDSTHQDVLAQGMRTIYEPLGIFVESASHQCLYDSILHFRENEKRCPKKPVTVLHRKAITDPSRPSYRSTVGKCNGSGYDSGLRMAFHINDPIDFFVFFITPKREFVDLLDEISLDAADKDDVDSTNTSDENNIDNINTLFEKPIDKNKLIGVFIFPKHSEPMRPFLDDNDGFQGMDHVTLYPPCVKMTDPLYRKVQEEQVKWFVDLRGEVDDVRGSAPSSTDSTTFKTASEKDPQLQQVAKLLGLSKE